MQPILMSQFATSRCIRRLSTVLYGLGCVAARLPHPMLAHGAEDFLDPPRDCGRLMRAAMAWYKRHSQLQLELLPDRIGLGRRSDRQCLLCRSN
jgi:hypothetical protein